MMKTFETRIALTPEQGSILEEYADLYARVEHKLFQAYAQGKKISSLKNAFLQQEKITARQFNAIRISLEGKINSIKERQKIRKQELSEKIKSLTKKIKNIKSPLVQHQKKRRLAQLQQHLAKVEEEIAGNKVPLTFGSKKLFRAQFHLKESQYASHDAWKKVWKQKRKSSIFCLGSKGETAGNQSASLFLDENNQFFLRLRLPDALGLGKYLTIEKIDFSYGKEELLQSLQLGKACSYRFLHDDKGWRIFASTEVAVKKSTTPSDRGAIGIDINVDHIALVEVNRHGNPISKATYRYHTQGKSKQQIRAQIGDISKAIALYALQKQKPLVVEKLEFTKKRALLRESSPDVARKLSSFAYSSILTHIFAKAAKEGIAVHTVNPAYTSIIGKTKFATRYGLSTHHGAALTIGRRHYRFSERPTFAQGRIPDGKGGHVALCLPVRNRHEHVWRFWSRSNKKITAASRMHLRTASRRSLGTRQTTHVTESPPEVKSENLLGESLEALLV